jgi:hypothetical protein
MLKLKCCAYSARMVYTVSILYKHTLNTLEVRQM